MNIVLRVESHTNVKHILLPPQPNYHWVRAQVRAVLRGEDAFNGMIAASAHNGHSFRQLPASAFNDPAGKTLYVFERHVANAPQRITHQYQLIKVSNATLPLWKKRIAF